MPFSVSIKHTYTSEHPTMDYGLGDYDNIETQSDIASNGMFQYLSTTYKSLFEGVKDFNTLSDAIEHIILALTTIADCGVRHLQNRATDKYDFTIIGKISANRVPIVAGISSTVTNRTTAFLVKQFGGRSSIDKIIRDQLEKHLKDIHEGRRLRTPIFTTVVPGTPINPLFFTPVEATNNMRTVLSIMAGLEPTETPPAPTN